MAQILSWHRWLLDKEIQERKLKQKAFVDLQKNTGLAQRKSQEKNDQLAKANKAYEKWIEEKNAAAKKNEVIRQRKNAKHKAEKEKETEMKKVKAQNNYKEWKCKKYEEEVEKKKRDMTKEIEKSENVLYKQRVNKEAFDNWNESMRTRKRDPFVSYVYSSGKLVGKCK